MWSRMSYEYVPIKEVMLEKSIYRMLTKISYHDYSGEDVSLSSIINEMLKEYLHTYVLSKRMGHMLMPKETVKTAIDEMDEEQIKQASVANANRYREGAIIEHGKPSLNAYLQLMKSFAKANGFDMEVSKSPENDNPVLIISFQMGNKFSEFLGITYMMLLQEFCDIDRIEITETALYVEYKPKQEQVVPHTTE